MYPSNTRHKAVIPKNGYAVEDRIYLLVKFSQFSYIFCEVHPNITRQTTMKDDVTSSYLKFLHCSESEVTDGGRLEGDTPDERVFLILQPRTEIQESHILYSTKG